MKNDADNKERIALSHSALLMHSEDARCELYTLTTKKCRS